MSQTWLNLLCGHPNDYRGDSLLDALESETKNQGIKQLFVLTTSTALWFEETGFKNQH